MSQRESRADQKDWSSLVVATLAQPDAHPWDALEHWLALVAQAEEKFLVAQQAR